MATDFQSSFIPKDPITQSGIVKKKTSIISVLAVSFFILSILVAGGMVIYKKMLKNNIVKAQTQLAEAEKNIDKKAIVEMSRFAARLDIVKSIVAKHYVISNVLSSISSSTVSSVYFTAFNYGAANGTGLVLNLEGKAPSYAAIALQEDILLKNKDFASVKFSDLSLTDKGAVSFKLIVDVRPETLVYVPPVTSTRTASTTKTDSLNNVSQELENIDDLDNLGLDLDNI